MFSLYSFLYLRTHEEKEFKLNFDIFRARKINQLTCSFEELDFISLMKSTHFLHSISVKQGYES